jgi:hypothetical protein
MKSTLLTIAVSLTIGSATTSYHLSSLPQPTDAQKNLIILFNSITTVGATAIFGLLDDKDNDDRPTVGDHRPNPSEDAISPESKNSLPPMPPGHPTTATLPPSPARSASTPQSSIHPQPIESAPTTPAIED